MKRLMISALTVLAGTAQAETRFAAIAFHDVVDARADRSDDAVTTDNLVRFFDWLQANGWTPVSAQQVKAAGEGGPPLPEKAILLSFDDGYKSFFTRVYPLLLAYNYPAVLALVDAWMDVPEGGMVNYGGTLRPRRDFLTWDEVRRMQASGLVEVASHSHDLHRVAISTREGNSAPSARTWAWDASRGRRETDAEHQERVRADLAKSFRSIEAETGRPPLAIVWPFGRHSGPAVLAAADAGFKLALNLEPELADASKPMGLARYYPTRDPDLGEIVANLAFRPVYAQTIRVACVDLAPLAAAADAASQDALLGKTIEDIRALGANLVVMDVGHIADGKLVSAWLPTQAAPMAADIFGRAARQIGTRAGVSVYARVPAGADALAADAARVAPIDGIAMAGSGVAAPPVGHAPSVDSVRAARDGDPSNPIAAAGATDPRLRLMLVQADSPAGPPAGVDLLMTTADPAAMQAAGWFSNGYSGRLILRLADGDAVRKAQMAGATGIALCPWDGSTSLAPIFSSASFPHRP